MAIYISLAQGPLQALQAAAAHITRDLTTELAVHVYIAGWALLLYGLYRLLRPGTHKLVEGKK